ncbi:MAG: Sir2 family NAD-dependent protein deacetylase, partial [Acidobacteriota bacterium]
MSTDSVPIAPLTDALNRLDSGHLVVITGAGVSLASGVPTFRGDDPDAVWRNDILEKGTFRYFREDPAASWQWSMRLFGAIQDAEPNAGHHALDALGDW